MNSGLAPEEDAELRRLHFFRRFGVVAHRFARRYDDLRSRDRRQSIREPDEQSLVISSDANRDGDAFTDRRAG